jgi:hypothetical protein
VKAKLVKATGTESHIASSSLFVPAILMMVEL